MVLEKLPAADSGNHCKKIADANICCDGKTVMSIYWDSLASWIAIDQFTSRKAGGIYTPPAVAVRILGHQQIQNLMQQFLCVVPNIWDVVCISFREILLIILFELYTKSRDISVWINSYVLFYLNGNFHSYLHILYSKSSLANFFLGLISHF